MASRAEVKAAFHHHARRRLTRSSSGQAGALRKESRAGCVAGSSGATNRPESGGEGAAGLRCFSFRRTVVGGEGRLPCSAV